MHIKREFVLSRNRYLAYSSEPFFVKCYIPDRLSLTLPMIAGRFVILNYNRGLLPPDNIPFGSYIQVVGDKFEVINDNIYVNWNDIKYHCGIVYTGDDYRLLLSKIKDAMTIDIMLLEPGEIFCVMKSPEYWTNYPEKIGEKITIRDQGYYSPVYNEYEEYIGYYIGESIEPNMLCIRLRK